MNFFTLPLVYGKVKKVNSRRAPSPTEAMEDGEIVIFQRNVDPRCTMTSLHFTVIKEETREEGTNDLYFMFYAIAGELNDGLTILPQTDLPLEKYVNQIAVIRCTHGWIDELKTFPQSLNPGGPTENPLRCGIGTILTELCLIDPGIYNRRQGNLALGILQGFPDFQRVRMYCYKIVGLCMAAETYDGTYRGAHVYFTAAINMKYRLLLIESSSGPGSSLKIFRTQVAKNNYDSDTGSILPCEDCSDVCPAWGYTWFFCAGRG